MMIETNFDSKYRKVLVAARRARQLQGGSHALVASQSNKVCRIAQDEISAGKIAYVNMIDPKKAEPLLRALQSIAAGQ